MTVFKMCVPESLVPALLGNPPLSLAVAFLEVLGSSSALLASITNSKGGWSKKLFGCGDSGSHGLPLVH